MARFYSTPVHQLLEEALAEVGSLRITKLFLCRRRDVGGLLTTVVASYSCKFNSVGHSTRRKSVDSLWLIVASLICYSLGKGCFLPH